MSKNTKIGIAGGVCLLVLVVVLLLVWKSTRQAPEAGAKVLTISITHMDGAQKEVTLHTDAEYLLNALQEEGLVSGYDSEFGFTIDTVDGEFADAEKGQWWVFTKSGEWVDTAVDATVIQNGDSFAFSVYAS